MGIIEEAATYKGRVYPIPNKKTFYIIQKPMKSEKFYRRKNQKIIELAWKVLIAHKDKLKDSHLIEAYIDYILSIGYKGVNKKGERVYQPKRKPDNNVVRMRKIDYHFDGIIGILSDTFRPPFCA